MLLFFRYAFIAFHASSTTTASAAVIVVGRALILSSTVFLSALTSVLLLTASNTDFALSYRAVTSAAVLAPFSPQKSFQ